MSQKQTSKDKPGPLSQDEEEKIPTVKPTAPKPGTKSSTSSTPSPVMSEWQAKHQGDC